MSLLIKFGLEIIFRIIKVLRPISLWSLERHDLGTEIEWRFFVVVEMESLWLWLRLSTRHVEGLDEETEVLRHRTLSKHLPYGLLLVADNACPLVVDVASIFPLLYLIQFENITIRLLINFAKWMEHSRTEKEYLHCGAFIALQRNKEGGTGHVSLSHSNSDYSFAVKFVFLLRRFRGIPIFSKSGI